MNNHIPSSNDLIIRPASFNDIQYIQDITAAIWPVAYKEILSNDQIEYMLGMFYSTPSLEKQLKDNHHFFLAVKNAQPVGFASFSHENEAVYKLQKIYVLPDAQGSGAGKALLKTIETITKSMGGNYLQLNVNRMNKAKEFYEHNGFAVIDEKDFDIGNGYFMKDYVMQKSL